MKLERWEYRITMRYMRRYNGNVAKVAKELGIAYKTVYNWLYKWRKKRVESFNPDAWKQSETIKSKPVAELVPMSPVLYGKGYWRWKGCSWRTGANGESSSYWYTDIPPNGG